MQIAMTKKREIFRLFLFANQVLQLVAGVAGVAGVAAVAVAALRTEAASWLATTAEASSNNHTIDTLTTATA